MYEVLKKKDLSFFHIVIYLEKQLYYQYLTWAVLFKHCAYQIKCDKTLIELKLSLLLKLRSHKSFRDFKWC